MYAKNITTFLKHLLGADGGLTFDRQDEITKETLVTHQGEVTQERVRSLVMASA
jgi:NAD(P) transhydrogenase subunit alpha